MSKFKQINYIYVLNNIFKKFRKANPVNCIAGSKESFSFRAGIFKIIVRYLKKLKKNRFYLLNVGDDFDLCVFFEYIKDVCKFVEYKENKYLTVFKYSNKLIIIVKNKNLFIKLHENKKQFIKKIKKRYSISRVSLVLFVDKNYNRKLLEFMFKKKYKDIVCKNCLAKLIKSRLLNSKKKEHLNLYKLIKKKEKHNVNMSAELIYTMCTNTSKLIVNYADSLDIEKYLKSKLFNQDKALNAVLSVINSNYQEQEDDNKPLGSWILCGPSGTGKTELAKILSHALFNSNKNLLKIDMSEYMEPHSISKLIGSPQGYVNYGEETSLSAKFKESSSLVIVFDEIEKAYKEFTTIMLQVLDEGKLVLANGEILNFNKSFIIFTSNLGYSEKSRKKKISKKFVLKKINEFFRAEFLNRLTDIIVFDPVSVNHSYSILNKFLAEYAVKFDFRVYINNLVRDSVIRHTYNKMYGSRPLRRTTDYTFDMFNLSKAVFKLPKNYFVNYSSNTIYDNKVNNTFNFFKKN